jgi:hypothetical protein
MSNKRVVYVKASGTESLYLYGVLALIGFMVILAVFAPQFIMAFNAVRTIGSVLGG